MVQRIGRRGKTRRSCSSPSNFTLSSSSLPRATSTEKVSISAPKFWGRGENSSEELRLAGAETPSGQSALDAGEFWACCGRPRAPRAVGPSLARRSPHQERSAKSGLCVPLLPRQTTGGAEWPRCPVTFSTLPGRSACPCPLLDVRRLPRRAAGGEVRKRPFPDLAPGRTTPFAGTSGGDSLAGPRGRVGGRERSGPCGPCQPGPPGLRRAAAGCVRPLG